MDKANFKLGGYVSLGIVAMVLAAAPLAGESAAETMSERCQKTLKENYGAVEVSNLNTHRKGHDQVYGDAQLSGGESIRVRCTMAQGNVAKVQVFAPPPTGSPYNWSKWTSASEYRVPPGTAVEPDAKSPPEEAPSQAEAPVEPRRSTPPAN